VQRAALEEDKGSYARTIMNRKLLNIEDFGDHRFVQAPHLQIEVAP
jgi:hypothetical protein